MSSASAPIAGRPAGRPAGRARQHAPARTDVQARPWVRLAGFTALSLYGIERWSRLLVTPPSLRLVGLAALAIGLAGGVPPLRRLLAPLPRYASRTIAGVATFALALVALPIAGVRWHLVWYVKIAVAAREIGHGLGGLGNILVPYDGFDHRVTLVIMLGAAVLLVDAGAVLAFAPRRISDARRATAALPLIALAVVPSTLVHPTAPSLQGLLLFVLVAFFVWGERLRFDGGRTALVLLAMAGLAGAVVTPVIDGNKPWFDYEKWSGATSIRHLASFSWNQTYGPLHWPQKGNEVLSVRAKTGHYWKAENLDDFDGTAWVQGPPTPLPAPGETGAQPFSPSLPAPSPAAVHKYSETIRVTIQGMRTSDLIGAGQWTLESRIPGHSHRVLGTGAIAADRVLGPGVSYQARVYTATPTDPQLTAATTQAYPWAALTGYLSVSIPTPTGARFPVRFAGFHEAPDSTTVVAEAGPGAVAYVRRSPYGQAYQLAQRLASESHNELQFVRNVMAYLSTGNGFRYDQSPALARYPLESFLFKAKLGYCQQFSGAMALLLRMGGVPARVATGFATGSRDSQAGTFQVADTDAHAWDEVWFPTYGWVTFDPTPASAPARGGIRASSISGRPTPNTPGKTAGTPRGVKNLASAAGGITHAHHHGATGTSDWLLAGAAAALLALCLLGWLVWTLMRPVGSTEQLIAELELALERTGRPLHDGVTLAALEDRYRFTPDVAGYIRALRLSRYGGRATAPDRAQRRALRRELGLGLGPLGRLRALRALPPRLHGGHP
ncbi:MAG: transglutaminase domain-containing protein [Solirubrobacteraceae bacterium]